MSLKKHPPNNEPCPTCGGPCKMAKCGLCNGNGEHLSGLMFGNSTAHCHECHGTGQLPTDSLHDTLVQQAVDEAVFTVLNEIHDIVFVQHLSGVSLSYYIKHHPSYIKLAYPNAIPKDG